MLEGLTSILVSKQKYKKVRNIHKFRKKYSSLKLNEEFFFSEDLCGFYNLQNSLINIRDLYLRLCNSSTNNNRTISFENYANSFANI